MAAKTPFELVVREHGSTVLRVCRALLGPSDVDDAWADTFLAALQAYPRLPADANVEAWLVTIAQRKATDHLRRTARQATPMAELPERAGPDTDALDLDLLEALARLPNKQRLAVVHHHLVGLPHAEVATLVGGTEAAARRAAADGIAALRRTNTWRLTEGPNS